MKEHSLSCEFPEGCSCGATDYNELFFRCQRAEAFASRIERGDVQFAKRCDEELKRISEMPLDKRISESISDAVQRVLNERNYYKGLIDNL